MLKNWQAAKSLLIQFTIYVLCKLDVPLSRGARGVFLFTIYEVERRLKKFGKSYMFLYWAKRLSYITLYDLYGLQFTRYDLRGGTQIEEILMNLIS